MSGETPKGDRRSEFAERPAHSRGSHSRVVRPSNAERIAEAGWYALGQQLCDDGLLPMGVARPYRERLKRALKRAVEAADAGSVSGSQDLREDRSA